jgi:hypothetical protein
MTSVKAFTAVIVLIAAGTASAPAQDSVDRTVDQYTCKDIMREDDQDASIAFLHGYLLGKSGSSNFNVEALTKQTDAFINSCLDNPGNKAVDVLVEAIKAN